MWFCDGAVATVRGFAPAPAGEALPPPDPLHQGAAPPGPARGAFGASEGRSTKSCLSARSALREVQEASLLVDGGVGEGKALPHRGFQGRSPWMALRPGIPAATGTAAAHIAAMPQNAPAPSAPYSGPDASVTSAAVAPMATVA